MPYGYHDPAKGEKPFVVGCGAFGGRSKKTGKPVGERHRWPNGWGKGRCEYCGRCLEDVMSKPKPVDPASMPLAAVIERCVDAEGVPGTGGNDAA